MRPIQRDVERTLERGIAADLERLSGSCADILAHHEALWTFVEHDGVEPTNNHAELELRDFVLWRRRSFGTQSDRGERFAERVMTAVRTARKLGLGCTRLPGLHRDGERARHAAAATTWRRSGALINSPTDPPSDSNASGVVARHCARAPPV
jgi:hypothetical protein